jgi:hypothetical protein
MNSFEVMNLITYSEIKLNLKGTQGKPNHSTFIKISMQLFYVECGQVALTLKFPLINCHGALMEVSDTLLSDLIPIH